MQLSLTFLPYLTFLTSPIPSTNLTDRIQSRLVTIKMASYGMQQCCMDSGGTSYQGRIVVTGWWGMMSISCQSCLFLSLIFSSVLTSFLILVVHPHTSFSSSFSIPPCTLFTFSHHSYFICLYYLSRWAVTWWHPTSHVSCKHLCIFFTRDLFNVMGVEGDPEITTIITVIVMLKS